MLQERSASRLFRRWAPVTSVCRQVTSPTGYQNTRRLVINVWHRHCTAQFEKDRPDTFVKAVVEWSLKRVPASERIRRTRQQGRRHKWHPVRLVTDTRPVFALGPARSKSTCLSSLRSSSGSSSDRGWIGRSRATSNDELKQSPQSSPSVGHKSRISANPDLLAERQLAATRPSGRTMESRSTAAPLPSKLLLSPACHPWCLLRAARSSRPAVPRPRRSSARK